MQLYSNSITGTPVSDFVRSAPKGNSVIFVRQAFTNRLLSFVTKKYLLFLLQRFTKFSKEPPIINYPIYVCQATSGFSLSPHK